MRRAKKNIYTHEIELKELSIKNSPSAEFRGALEAIAYRGYIVENLQDRRKVVITKPGGKFTFGTIKREDFMVWAYNPREKSLYLISHKNILDDLEEKGEIDTQATIQIIEALEEVYNGKEPDKVLEKCDLKNPAGESPELLLKAYKWIWGQEDVNYPNGKGRRMSWEGISKNERGEWEKTGFGIVDLLQKLRNKKS